MRIISYKQPLKVTNFKKIMRLVRKLLISLNVFKWRFEIVKTNKSYKLEFHILRSRLSNVEEDWLDKQISLFIQG